MMYIINILLYGGIIAVRIIHFNMYLYMYLFIFFWFLSLSFMSQWAKSWMCIWTPVSRCRPWGERGWRWTAPPQESWTPESTSAGTTLDRSEPHSYLWSFKSTSKDTGWFTWSNNRHWQCTCVFENLFGLVWSVSRSCRFTLYITSEGLDLSSHRSQPSSSSRQPSYQNLTHWNPGMRT